MLSEYDVVRAKRRIGDEVPEGALGAVLYIYECEPPEYEVEFVDDTGNTLAVLTVSEDDVVKVDS